jgi:hypothetical protein
MRRYVGALTAVLWLAAAPARAQIDDTKRLLLEGGYEDGLGNPGPNGAYAFLYLNRPGVAGPGSAWRLALAPVYLDTELGLPGLLGYRTDVGLGFSGGGYAFSRKEVVRGDQRFGESFIGNGGGPSLSFYPKIGDIGPVPLSGVVRFSAVYTDYQATSQTDANFEIPPDEWTGAARVGLRLGGQEPGLGRGPALEVSTWYEGRVRDRPGTYGYNHDRFVKREVNLYWMRFLLVLPPDSGVRASAGASVGGGDRLGRLTAYRLGGMLTQSAEFPLIIPGYFSQEIAAREFGHVWARYGIPVERSRRFFVNVLAAGASVTPIRGTDPGGSLHAGMSVGLEFAPPKGALHGELTYGYAPRAVRGNHRGGEAFAITAELDFMTPDLESRKGVKTSQQGFGWLLGR